METIVLYDSNFGNTKLIAEIVAHELGKDAKAVFISDFNKKDLARIKLLIAGSPINGWKPSPRMGTFLDNLENDELQGIKAASFDTRIDLFIHGDATKKISAKLQAAGAKIISEPQAFFVKGKEGPLSDGELERAREWAKTIK
jgi:flavodoxin